jgi:hypothetical protein
MKKLLMIAFLAFAGSYSTISAQQPTVIVSDKTGWHKITETTVSFKKESDEIVVMGADKFAAIKLRIKDAPIDLVNLDIYFEDGGKQHVNIAMPIKTEGETREIKIDGGERDLKKVAFVYKTLPNRDDEKARVELWGLKTNEDKHKGTE